MANKFVSANYYLVVTWSLPKLQSHIQSLAKLHGHILSNKNDSALHFHAQVLQVLLLHASHLYLEEVKERKIKAWMAFPHKNVIPTQRHNIK